MDKWVKVVFADECSCECGEDDCRGECGCSLICAQCGGDYADCPCPGPTQDGMKYATIDDELYAQPE